MPSSPNESMIGGLAYVCRKYAEQARELAELTGALLQEYPELRSEDVAIAARDVIAAWERVEELADKSDGPAQVVSISPIEERSTTKP